jgi:hypothetical protein
MSWSLPDGLVLFASYGVIVPLVRTAALHVNAIAAKAISDAQCWLGISHLFIRRLKVCKAGA